MNTNLGHPVKNRNKVPKKQWDQWSNHARKVFNGVMQDMRPTMQFAFLHPDCPPMHKSHWLTMRWNAAWFAAIRANGTTERFAGATRFNGTTKKKARKHR